MKKIDQNISNKIKWLSLLFAILVVLFHSHWAGGLHYKASGAFDASSYQAFRAFSSNIRYVALAFFFFFSAFWFSYGIKTKGSVTAEFKKRVRSLIIPFIAWNVIAIAIGLTTGDIVINTIQDLVYILTLPYDAPLYYMVCILIYMIIFALPVYRFRENRNKLLISGIVISLASVVIAALYSEQLYSFLFWLKNLFIFMPVFAVGVIFGVLLPEKIISERKTDMKTIVIGAVVMISSFIVLCMNPAEILCPFLGLTTFFGLWLILDSKLFRKPIPTFFDAGMYIYAMHYTMLMPFIEDKIWRIFAKTYLSGWKIILIKLTELVTIILAACVTRYIIRKIAPKIDKVLSGGR